MKGTRAALRYAKATLNLAKDKSVAKEVNDDMLLIDQTIAENSELLDMLKNPIIKASAKKTVLTQIFGEKINATTMSVINLLIKNRRLQLLPLVAKEFTKIYDDFRNVDYAYVTSAVPLTKELEERVLSKIKEFSSNTIILKNIIDPSIIGGFILRFGDLQYDSSISSQLKRLLTNFESKHYISKI
jgi:F-type H+-transporting ATPase subunit delta